MKNSMTKRMLLLCLFICGLVVTYSFVGQSATAMKQNTTSASWFKNGQPDKQEIQLQVDLFLSTTCPHCQAADRFFQRLVKKKPWLMVNRYYINQDHDALDRLNTLVTDQQITINPFAVPAIFFCNARWLGFDSAKTSGKELLKSLNYCRTQIIKQGQLTATTSETIRQWSTSSWYQSNIMKSVSWSEVILTLAAFDVLTPCSALVFFTIIAFLFFMPSKRLGWMAAGMLLLCIGVLHYIQQTHLSFFYQMQQGLRWPTVVIGFCLLGLLIVDYKNKDKNKADTSKFQVVKGLIMVLSVLGLYIHQSTCIPNFSLVFQQYLLLHSLPVAQHLLYIAAFQVTYLLIFSGLLLLVFFALKRVKKYQTILQNIMLAILFFAALYLLTPLQ